MARFQFRLASLQKYRESLRDQCRQLLAQWLARDAELAAELERVARERDRLLGEMRDAQQAETTLDMEKLISRRYHAGVLSAEIQGLALRRREVAEQVSLCRKALVKADQGVKVLEQLRERQLREFERAEEHREAREREEIWQAGRMRET